MRDNGLAMDFIAADLSRLDSLNMLPAHSFGKVTPPSRHRGFAPGSVKRIGLTRRRRAAEKTSSVSPRLRVLRETFFSG